MLLSNTAFPQFGNITVTLGRTGNLFIAGHVCGDEGNYSLSIRKISPAGTITLIAAGARPTFLPPGGSIGDGGHAITAQLGFISNLAVDFAGNLFLSDLDSHRVRKIDPNGIITTVWRERNPELLWRWRPATSATLNYPFGLTAARPATSIARISTKSSGCCVRLPGQECG